MIRGREFSAPPADLWKEGKVLIKVHKYSLERFNELGDLMSFRVGEHPEVAGVWLPREDVEAHLPLPHASLSASISTIWPLGS